MSRMFHRIQGQENLDKNYVSSYDSRWMKFFVGTASGDSDYVWVHQGNSAARVVPWSWAEPTDDIRWETPEK